MVARSQGPIVAHEVTREGKAEGIVMWRLLQGNGGAAAQRSEVRLLVCTHSIQETQESRRLAGRSSGRQESSKHEAANTKLQG